MILIVDDRPENIFSLQKLLELNNFAVDTASSGEEALRKILKNTYFLVILDVQMPGMDGFEVAEAITGYSKSKDIPIIFLSAVNLEKRFITKGYTSGGMDYVTKPFDPEILLLKVSTFYRLHLQTRELHDAQQKLREEVAERKAAQEALYHSLEELRSILESIQHIAFTLNREGNIEFVNRYWHEYAEGRENLPATPEEGPSITECIEKAMASGRQEVLEVCIKPLKSEEYRYHLLSMTPVRKDNVIAKWVGIFTDIHEQKMMNQLLENRVSQRTEELQRANRDLAASNHELQQFAYVASHDLKEPLRKIQVFGNLIHGKFGTDQQDTVQYLSKIISSADRMNKLITDVLDYSKLSISEKFHATDVNVIIREILDDMELLIREKSADIVVDNIPPLWAVPGQMRQVFQNILSNALKFSATGVKPAIHIRAERVSRPAPDATVDKNGQYCRIAVSDNGIGFDEVYLDKIFVIFQRLHGRNEYEGTGIGLAIVKKIIDTHGGVITATSEEGKGSKFILVLPMGSQQTKQTEQTYS
ncbi:hybrid sensor histidine kinase/response regulator [Chitinophaga barathri]|uniref:histidine kinase n=1 Tax=Chitinophaga barathri TaxID=1647451 RepID=A0A3N4M5U0_9BACT|nr:response regulator [Chitinophaga barathri]RPD38674.1 response regulator [Chitinophaga barathri]